MTMDYQQIEKFWSDSARRFNDDRAGMLATDLNFIKYRDQCEKENFLGLLELAGIKNLLNLRVLEVGCGTGRWTNWLGGFCRGAVGIDISAEMLEIAQRNAPCNGRVAYRQARAEEFCEGDYDLIYFSSVLQYLNSSDVIKTLTNAKKTWPDAAIITRDTLTNNCYHKELEGNYPVIYRTKESLEFLLKTAGYRWTIRQTSFKLPLRTVAFLKYLPWLDAKKLTEKTEYLEPLVQEAYYWHKGRHFPEPELEMWFTLVNYPALKRYGLLRASECFPSLDLLSARRTGCPGTGLSLCCNLEGKFYPESIRGA